jgi:hypothetical protein
VDSKVRLPSIYVSEVRLPGNAFGATEGDPGSKRGVGCACVGEPVVHMPVEQLHNRLPVQATHTLEYDVMATPRVLARPREAAAESVASAWK